MSCMICKDESISKISNFIARLLNQGFNSFGFSASQKIFNAFDNCVVGGFYNSNRIYNELYTLNYIAYNERYNIQGEEIEISKNPDIDIWEPMQQFAQHWHVEILKNIQCLEYQLTEKATENEPKTKALQELVNILALYIATNNNIYNGIDWE